jgi:hypothetical protein
LKNIKKDFNNISYKKHLGQIRYLSKGLIRKKITLSVLKCFGVGVAFYVNGILMVIERVGGRLSVIVKLERGLKYKMER